MPRGITGRLEINVVIVGVFGGAAGEVWRDGGDRWEEWLGGSEGGEEREGRR